jgi:hypothetical protein
MGMGMVMMMTSKCALRVKGDQIDQQERANES